jgi:hypothetical protein
MWTEGFASGYRRVHGVRRDGIGDAMTPTLIGTTHARARQIHFLFGVLPRATKTASSDDWLSDGMLGAILNDTLLSPPGSTAGPRVRGAFFSRRGKMT